MVGSLPTIEHRVEVSEVLDHPLDTDGQNDFGQHRVSFDFVLWPIGHAELANVTVSHEVFPGRAAEHLMELQAKLGNGPHVHREPGKGSNQEQNENWSYTITQLETTSSSISLETHELSNADTFPSTD